MGQADTVVHDRGFAADAREPRAVRWSAAIYLILIPVFVGLVLAGGPQNLVAGQAFGVLANLALAVLIWALRSAFREPTGSLARIATSLGLIGSGSAMLASILPVPAVGSFDPLGLLAFAGQGAWFAGLGLFRARLPSLVLRLGLIAGIGAFVEAARIVAIGTGAPSPATSLLQASSAVLNLAVLGFGWGLTSVNRWTRRPTNLVPI